MVNDPGHIVKPDHRKWTKTVVIIYVSVVIEVVVVVIFVLLVAVAVDVIVVDKFCGEGGIVVNVVFVIVVVVIADGPGVRKSCFAQRKEKELGQKGEHKSRTSCYDLPSFQIRIGHYFMIS